MWRRTGRGWAGSTMAVSYTHLVREETQLERLVARNHYSIQQAKARIAAQMSEEERLQYADAVIDNNGTMEETWRQVEQLCAELFAQ